MNFDWWTFGLQTVNFLILAWLLQRFLYRPVTAIIDRRKQAAEAAVQAADAAGQEADKVRRDYESRIAALDDERRGMLEEAHAKTEAEREKARKEAVQEAEKRMAEVDNAIEEERTAVLASMKKEIGDLAVEMAENLLVGLSKNGPESAVVDSIVRHLQALPESERQRMKRSMEGGHSTLNIITAAPVAEDDRPRLEKCLRSLVGDGAILAFEVDPDIIGGAELHSPDLQLKLSWKSELEGMKKLFVDNEKS